MPKITKRFFLPHILIMLLASFAWQQTILADTSGRAPTFSIVTTGSPNFALSQKSGISWLLEDVDIKSDAPLSTRKAKEMLKEAIIEVMQNKGISITPFGSPSEYYLAYTLASESTLDDAALLKRYNATPGFSAATPGANVYEKGTLLIHIIDAKTRQTLWQSVVQANIQNDASDAQRRANIHRVVKSMLDKLKVRP